MQIESISRALLFQCINFFGITIAVQYKLHRVSLHYRCIYLSIAAAEARAVLPRRRKLTVRTAGTWSEQRNADESIPQHGEVSSLNQKSVNLFLLIDSSVPSVCPKF